MPNLPSNTQVTKVPVTAKEAPKVTRTLSDASKAQKQRSTLNNAAEKIMFGTRSRNQ